MTIRKLVCEECRKTFTPKGANGYATPKRCSGACYGKWRAKTQRDHMKRIAPTGKAGWTSASRASYLAKMSGPNNPAWKGGAMERTHGNYQGVRYVRCPPEFLMMARADGYVMEHRLRMAQRIGRLLLRSEVVHHEDHRPSNNDPANLELWPDNRTHKLAEHGRDVTGAACLWFPRASAPP